MSTRTRIFLRQNVLGLVAIFIALSGTAYATHPGGANTISSEDVINNEIRSEDIRSANVQNSDLGSGAVTSGKIANGGVRSVNVNDDNLTGTDMLNNSLTGDDINESSLSFECPAGYELAGKDVCYEPESASAAHANANFDTALSTCANNGDRLPTLAEGWAVMTDLPNPDQFVVQQTWTADQSSGSTSASTLTKNFEGTITRSSTTTTTSFPFRCVTSPHG
jgi:hypothetical protein